MIGWIYEGPFDHLPAQVEVGGYPFIDDKLKAKELNAIFMPQSN